MELNHDYLTLKLRRLKSLEPMDLSGRGLVFVILKGGQGACQCGPTLHPLEAGAVLVTDSAAGGKMRARENGEMVFWSFGAELEHLFALFSGREICLLQKVAESFKTGRLYPGSSPLAQQCLRLVEEAPAPFSLEHRSHALRIVSAILSAEFKAAQPRLADFVPMRDHVLQVFERLGTNELLSWPVGELARKFNCSRRHLNRLFHQHFGVSVAALRMEMRLLKAVSLLVDPDAKIIHVAEKCGFNHLGLFNTCFKKRFGSSPGQWRKSATEARRNGNGPAQAVEPMALRGLLRDITAAKAGVSPQTLARHEGPSLAYAAENCRDRRTRIDA